MRGVDFLRLHLRLHKRHGQQGVERGVRLHAGSLVDRGGQLQGQGVQRAFGVQPRGQRVGFAFHRAGQGAGERGVRRGGVGLGGGVGGGGQRQFAINGDDGRAQLVNLVRLAVAVQGGGKIAYQRGLFAACPVLQGKFAQRELVKLQGNRQRHFGQRKRLAARRRFFFRGGAGEGDALCRQRLNVYVAAQQAGKAPDERGRLDGEAHLFVLHVDAFGAKAAGQRALRHGDGEHRRSERERVVQAGLRAQQPEKRAQRHARNHGQRQQNAPQHMAGGTRGGGGSGGRGGRGHGQSVRQVRTIRQGTGRAARRGRARA